MIAAMIGIGWVLAFLFAKLWWYERGLRIGLEQTIDGEPQHYPSVRRVLR